jgi:endonuclease/exonuclease/phosphatase family metal-dependent hydrolase
MATAYFPLSIASLNMHCGRDHAGIPYSISEAIKSLSVDVVLVQENWRTDAAESIARRAACENGYPYCIELDVLERTTLFSLGVITDRDADEPGGLGLAVLSRVPAVACGRVILGTAAGDMMERAAQIVDITVGDGDSVVRVVNAHLTHRLLYGPGQLRRLTRAVRGCGYPTVIAGDLNMCRPAIYLARPFRPVVRGRTWRAWQPWVQLDHVLVGDGIQRLGGHVCPAVGSDHLPIRASLHVGVPETVRGR